MEQARGGESRRRADGFGPAAGQDVRMTRSAPPIRRYVLLRHRDHGSSVPRWSMERIAATPPSSVALASLPVRRDAPRGSSA